MAASINYTMSGAKRSIHVNKKKQTILRHKVTRNTQDLCGNTYKTSLENMSRPEKWKDLSCSLGKKAQHCKDVDFTPTLIQNFNAIPSNLLRVFII